VLSLKVNGGLSEQKVGASQRVSNFVTSFVNVSTSGQSADDFHKFVVPNCPTLHATPRRLGEVAYHKSVQRDDFDFLELSAETSAISPNR
jgi:hypothetical protein